MSLVTFIKKNKDVRDQLHEKFRTPKLDEDINLVVPPLSNRYSLVGTAFDYLLRFYIERLNENVVTRSWVAEMAISHPMSPILEDAEIDAKTGEVLSYVETILTSKIKKILKEARSEYEAFITEGQITDQLIRSCLYLAQVDPIFRARYIDPNIGKVFQEDVVELRKLIELVDPEDFIAEDICLLNPTFGEGSKIVGGADADIYINGKIIDVKTTKNFEIRRSYFDQLIGYYILHHIGSIGEIKPKLQVSSLGIYYSRHGYLYEYDVDSIIEDVDLSAFVEWFKERAKEEYSNPIHHDQ
jgi:hypothetical protein